MPKLKPETAAARKSHILHAALVCFSQNGYHQTSMDDIVQESGLSKGGLYVHFSSKKDLFLALCELFIDQFRIFTIPASTGANSYEKLADLLLEMVATAGSEPFREISSLMTDVWAQNTHDPEINQFVGNLYEQVRAPLTKLIDEGIKDGTFKPVEPTAFANILIAVFEGLVIQDMIEEPGVDWSAVSRTLNTLIDGMRV